MADLIFNTFNKNLLAGSINPFGDNLMVLLVNGSYTPNQDTHQFRSDVTNEVVGTGYTSGGKLISGKSISVDNTINKAYLDATDVTWSSSSIVADAAVVWKSGGTPTTALLVGYYDFVTQKTSVSGNFVVSWSVSGLISLNN